MERPLGDPGIVSNQHELSKHLETSLALALQTVQLHVGLRILVCVCYSD